MAALSLDENGIWTDHSDKAVDYPATGNSVSFALEQNSFWFSHRNQVLLEVMKRFPFHQAFADIGGGNGLQAKFIAEHFPGRNIFLVEPGYQGCLNGRKRGLSHVYHTTFENFNFHDHQVTAAGMFDVLEHIEDDTAFLKALKAKMPENSILYLTVPAYNFLWSAVDDLGHHHRRYNLRMIKEVADNAGLQTLYASYFFSYLPPLTFFLRSLPYRLQRKRNDSHLLETEKEQHNPAPGILRVFNFFERQEIKRIRNSNVPFGASVLAVFKT